MSGTASRLRRAFGALLPRRSRVFRLLERLGVHVTPVRYCEPVPDTRTLPEDLWTRVSEVPGVDMRPAEQVRLVEELAAASKTRYDEFPRRARDARGGFHLDNDAFESVDAEVLYALLRRLRPRRVIEVGSGHSTLLIATALGDAAAEGSPPAELIAIDPNPNRAFSGAGDVVAAAGGRVECTVRREPVQRVPLSEFGRLGDGDVLFIDCSHVLAIGSDVQHLFLEVLPRLRTGVYVHVHDVFIPREYPRSWVVESQVFWNEQYALQAFLAFNRAFEVVLAAHYLHVHRPDVLRRAFASYDPATVAPGSFWIRRVG